MVMRDSVKRMISITAIACVSAFALLTLWDVTVNGLFESPDLDADHFIAGAGKFSIVVRFWLCLASVICLLIWLPFRFKLKPVLLKLSSAILVVGVFAWSALGLERFSPSYSEDVFQGIVDKFRVKKFVNARHVRKVLGEPLVSGRQDILIKYRPHEEAWLYSYMPSCGYGWQKRVIYFDSQGQMVDYLYMDEP